LKRWFDGLATTAYNVEQLAWCMILLEKSES